VEQSVRGTDPIIFAEIPNYAKAWYKAKHMGITLFASGKINDISAIPRLIEDLKAIAGERKWKYRVVDDGFDEQPDAAVVQSDSDRPGAVIKRSSME
jgi:hypothetical protein